MKTGDVLIYKTEKTDPFYKQFNDSKVSIHSSYMLWGDEEKKDVLTYIVRHLKTGITFNANPEELKEK